MNSSPSTDAIQIRFKNQDHASKQYSSMQATRAKLNRLTQYGSTPNLYQVNTPLEKRGFSPADI